LEELSRLEHVIGYNAVDTNGQGQVVALSDNGQIDVFNLERDELVLLRSFDVGNAHRYSVGDPFKLHQSQIYVTCTRAYLSAPFCCIGVYNIFTGCLERRLSYPEWAFGAKCLPECIVVTDKQILVGFNGRHRKGYTVKAYAL